MSLNVVQELLQSVSPQPGHLGACDYINVRGGKGGSSGLCRRIKKDKKKIIPFFPPFFLLLLASASLKTLEDSIF